MSILKIAFLVISGALKILRLRALPMSALYMEQTVKILQRLERAPPLL